MLDAAIIGARFFQFAAAMVLFGSALFYFYGFADKQRDAKRLKPCLLAAYIVALISAIGWILLQAASLAEPSGAIDPAFLSVVVLETGFGRVFLVRSVILVVAFAGFLIGDSRRLGFWLTQTICGALLLTSLAWFGHGATEEPYGLVHKLADIVHLLAAGVWIGALIVFAVLIMSLRSRAEALPLHFALRGFSSIGGSVVALLVLSGVVNSWFLVGPSHVIDILSTPYGVLLVAKLLLFAAMLVLAAANRLWLTPWLGKTIDSGAHALPMLKFTLGAEALLSLLVLLAVAWMGTLAPPASGL